MRTARPEGVALSRRKTKAAERIAATERGSHIAEKIRTARPCPGGGGGSRTDPPSPLGAGYGGQVGRFGRIGQAWGI